jgi:hypothetical protein
VLLNELGYNATIHEEMDGQRIGDENANGNNEWKRRTSITSLN